MPAAIQKRPPPFTVPPSFVGPVLPPERKAAEEMAAEAQALPPIMMDPMTGYPVEPPATGPPLPPPIDVTRAITQAPPLLNPALVPTGPEVAAQFERETRVPPQAEQPFSMRHPMMAAIGRGFERAMPIVAGAAEGMAAGAYEPMAGAALGKGFMAAELRPYQKLKLQTDIAKRMQDLELSQAHADYYRALAPSVDEKIRIQQHNAESLDFYRKVRGRAAEYSAQTRRQLADLKTAMHPAEFEALVQKTALTRATTEEKAQALAANIPAARVALYESEIPLHEAQTQFYHARTEATPGLTESQIERNRSESVRNYATAKAANMLAGQRSGNQAVDAATSRVLADVIAGDPNAEQRDASELAGFAANNVARFYQNDPQIDPIRDKVLQHLQTLTQPKGKMTTAQYWNLRTRIQDTMAGAQLKDEREAQLYDLAQDAKSSGLRIPTEHLNKPKLRESQGGPAGPNAAPVVRKYNPATGRLE